MLLFSTVTVHVARFTHYWLPDSANLTDEVAGRSAMILHHNDQEALGLENGFYVRAREDGPLVVAALLLPLLLALVTCCCCRSLGRRAVQTDTEHSKKTESQKQKYFKHSKKNINKSQKQKKH